MSHPTDGNFSLHSYRLPYFHLKSPLVWGYLLCFMPLYFFSSLSFNMHTKKSHFPTNKPNNSFYSLLLVFLLSHWAAPPTLPPFSSHVSISAGHSIYECLQRGRRAAGVTTFPDGISELISPLPNHSSQTHFVTESVLSLKSWLSVAIYKSKVYIWWRWGEFKTLSITKSSANHS